MTKGFLVGLLLFPALITVTIMVTPRILRQRSVPVTGAVAVIDPTGRVVRELRTTMTPAAVATNGRWGLACQNVAGTNRTEQPSGRRALSRLQRCSARPSISQLGGVCTTSDPSGGLSPFSN